MCYYYGNPINSLWSFFDVVNHIEELSTFYYSTLDDIDRYGGRSKSEFINSFRREVYSLKLKEKQKDLIWEYLNDDIDFRQLIIYGKKCK